MTTVQQAHTMQQEVEKYGVAAVLYPTTPRERQKLQGAIHRINKQYGNGMKIRTKRETIDGVQHLVAWRVA